VPAGYITAGEYGEAWPFTVRAGTLACTRSGAVRSPGGDLRRRQAGRVATSEQEPAIGRGRGRLTAARPMSLVRGRCGARPAS